MSDKRHKKHAEVLKALGTPIEWQGRTKAKSPRQKPLPGMESLFLPKHCPDCKGGNDAKGKACRTCRGSGFVPSDLGDGRVPVEVVSGNGGGTVAQCRDGTGSTGTAGSATDGTPGGNRVENRCFSEKDDLIL